MLNRFNRLRIFPSPWLVLISVCFWQSCSRETREPKPADVVGVWQCADLPRRFLKVAGKSDNVISEIRFLEDGRFAARALPLRSPHRFVELDGRWKIVDANATPSGKLSVRLDSGQFLIVVGVGSDMSLLLHIDVNERWDAEFTKVRGEDGDG